MANRNLALVQAACIAIALCGIGVVRAEAAAPLKPPLSALDPDKDGTVSLDEAKAAADRKFDALDTDHEGTLSLKETKGIFLKSTLPQADPDKDGTIDKTVRTKTGRSTRRSGRRRWNTASRRPTPIAMAHWTPTNWPHRPARACCACYNSLAGWQPTGQPAMWPACCGCRFLHRPGRLHSRKNASEDGLNRQVFPPCHGRPKSAAWIADVQSC